MARYFFDIRDGEECLDNEGTELPDEHVARQEALLFAAALLADSPLRQALGRKWTLVMRRDADVMLRLDIQL